MRAAFIESNPIPVKAALAMMGRIENVLRSPLVPLEPKHERRRARRRSRPRGRCERRASRRRSSRSSPIASLALRRHAGGHGAAALTPSSSSTTLLAALERGEVRAAERDDDGTWRAVPWVKRGILLGFRVGTLVDMSVGRRRHSLPFFDKHTYPAAALRRRRAACASCPAARRCVAARISRRASCACRRCT